MNNNKGKNTKKVLSVFLAALMILSCWVFYPPTASAATAGSYYVEIDWTVVKANNIKSTYQGYGSSADDTAGITIRYKNNNGTGNTIFNKDFDLKNGSKNDANGDMNTKGKHTLKTTLSGFPIEVYMLINDDNYVGFMGGATKAQLNEVRVGVDSNNMTTIWNGTVQLGSNVNAYAYSINMDSSKNGFVHGKADSDNVITDSKCTWPAPSPKTVTWSNTDKTDKTVTVPKPGASSSTVKTNDAIIKDQYGVNWYQAPVYALSTTSAPTTTSTLISGVSRAPTSVGTTPDCATVTVTNAAKDWVLAGKDSGGNGYERDVYLTAYVGNKTSVKTTTTTKVTIKNYEVNVTFENYDGTTLGNKQTNYYGLLNAVIPEHPNNRPYDAVNHYIADGWDKTADELKGIKADTTVTAQYITQAHDPYMEETFDPDSTCLAEGSTRHTCSVCKYTYLEKDNIPKKDHIWDDGVVTTEPTCLKPGIKTYTCNAYGTAAHKKEEVIPALGHNYEGKVTKEPTCHAVGIKTFTCTRCDASYTEEIPIVSDAHNFVYDRVKSEATCLADEVDVYRCANGCGAEKDVVKEGTKLNHEYTKLVPLGNGTHTYQCVNGCNETNEPVACSGGTASCKTKAKCEVCGESYGDFDANNHEKLVIDVSVPATCLETGLEQGEHCEVCGVKTIEQKVILALGHNFVDYNYNNDATCEEDGTETAKCERCEVTDTRTKPGTALGHDWDEGTVTKEATCSVEGNRHFICKRDNNHTKDEEIQKNPNNHNYVAGEVTAPTCTEKGYTTYTCSYGCGTSYGNDFVNPLGHDWTDVKYNWTDDCSACEVVITCERGCTETLTADIEVVNTVDATCVIPGSVTYRATAVSSDKKTFSDEKTVTGVLAPDNHKNLETVTEVLSSCTSAGHSEYQHCKDCGKDIGKVDYELKAHTFTKYEPDGKGKHTAVCDECKTARDTKDCTASEWITDEEAKCGIEGSKHTECTVCKQILETEVIEALKHVYTNYVYNNDATCQKDGTKTAACDRGCGEKDTVTAEGTKLEHKFGEWISDGNGSHSKSCTTCDPKVADVAVVTEACTLGDWVIDTDPTCEEPGSKHKECEVCGYKTPAEEIEKLGHKWNNGEITTVPNCVDKGEMTYTCQNDSSHTRTEPIEKDPTNHKTVKDIEKVDSTCQLEGHEAYKYCEACGTEVTKKVIIEKKDHIFTTYVSDGKGSHIAKCDTCKAEDGDIAEDVLPCNAGEWVVIKNATCEDSGIKVKKCTVCDYEMARETIDATGHSFTNYVSNNNATCQLNATQTATCDNGCGATETIDIPNSMKPHSFGEWNSDGKGSHWKSCTTCDPEIADVAVETEACTLGDWVIDTDPTCEGTGSKHKECAYCGYKTPAEEIEALGHIWDEGVITKAPSCTEVGEKTYTCKNDSSHKRTETVAKTEHKREIIPAVPATCTEGGLTQGVKCSVCGTIIEPQIKTSPLGHKKSAPVKENEVLPTCNSNGSYDEVVYCSVCGIELSRTTKTVPALSHVPGAPVKENVISSTCGAPGSYDEVVYCTLCGNELSRKKVITENLQHNFSEWIKTKEPTCTESGIEYRVCSNCGTKETNATAPLAHADNNADGFCDECGFEIKLPSWSGHSCICHNNNWFVRVLIWPIVRFFWKIFRIRHECACGNFHY